MNWYWELIRTGQLKEKFIRAREYSEEQRREAVEYYFAHGLSLTRTIRELALPIKRDALRSWIKEFEPERELNCKRRMPLVQCTQEQKEEAVAAVLCARGKTGHEIAEEYGINRPALYKWRRRLLAGEGDMVIRNWDTKKVSARRKRLSKTSLMLLEFYVLFRWMQFTRWRRTAVSARFPLRQAAFLQAVSPQNR